MSLGQGVRMYGPGGITGSDIISELVYALSLSVDALKAGAGQLTVVKAVATTPVVRTGFPVIDGYQTIEGDLVLLTAQASAVDNGLWNVYGTGWLRPADFANGTTVSSRTAVASAGTLNVGALWALDAPAPIVVGTSAQTWINGLVGKASTPDGQPGTALVTTGDQVAAGIKTSTGWRPRSIPYASLSAFVGTPAQQMAAAMAELLANGPAGEIVVEPSPTPYDFPAAFGMPAGINKIRGDDPERTHLRGTSTTDAGLIYAFGSGQSIEGLTLDGHSAVKSYREVVGAVIQFAKPGGATGGGTVIAGGVRLSASVASGATSLPLTAAAQWVSAALASALKAQPGEYVVLVEGAQVEVARIADSYIPGANPILLDEALRYDWTTAAKVSVRSTRCGVDGVTIKNGVFLGLDMWGPIGGFVRDSYFYDCLDTCLGTSDGGAQGMEIRGVHIDTSGLFGVAMDSVDVAYYGKVGQTTLGPMKIRMRKRDPRLGTDERDGVILMGASGLDLQGVTVDLSAIGAAESTATGVRFTGGGSDYSLRGTVVKGPGNGQTNTYGIRSAIADGHPLRAVINGGVLSGLHRGCELLASNDVAVRNMVMRLITDYAVNITAHGSVVQRLAVEGNIIADSFVGLAAAPAPAAGSILHKRGNLYSSIGYLAEAIDPGWTVNP